MGGAILAWNQYQELLDLRAGVMTKDERAELQKRLWDAEKRAKELADELAALRGQSNLEDGEGLVANEPANPETQNRRGGRRGGNGGGPGGGPNAMMALLEQPEVQRLMALQQRGQLDARYAALFKNLNLPPEQLEKLKALLVEKQSVGQDVLAAARSQGINLRDDPEAFRKMIASTQAEVDNSIKAVLGEEGFAKYQNYQETLPQRNVVSQLQQSLSYTSAPLSDSQAEQLVQILAQTTPKNTRGNRGGDQSVVEANVTVAVTAPGGRGGGNGGGPGGGIFNIGFGGGGTGTGGGGGPTITNEAITLAQGVLSGAQVQSLQQLQQQQQAQQQLQQTLRQSMEGQRGGGGGGGRNNNNAGGSTTPSPRKG